MVRNLGEGSTDEMVLGLLRAEIDSPQCGSDYAKMLDSFGFDRSALIDNGDLTDTYASHVRSYAQYGPRLWPQYSFVS